MFEIEGPDFHQGCCIAQVSSRSSSGPVQVTMRVESTFEVR